MTMPLPGLPSFNYIRAESVEQVTKLLREKNGVVRIFMGGTDILVQMRARALEPSELVDVKHLPGMTAIEFDSERGLRVGAAVTMNAMIEHADVKEHFPLLAEALQTAASYPIRNRATLGGNLCNASPCADSAPSVLVLEASLVAHGSKGERHLPAGDFFLGPGESALKADEFLKRIDFPVPPPGWKGRYEKLGRNSRGDLAVVSVAVMGFPDEGANSGCRFRIALGSVAPTPIRAVEAEEILAAGPIDENAFEKASRAAQAASSPIDDVRASARYRSAMVRSLTLRGLRSLWFTMGKEG